MWLDCLGTSYHCVGPGWSQPKRQKYATPALDRNLTSISLRLLLLLLLLLLLGINKKIVTLIGHVKYAFFFFLLRRSFSVYSYLPPMNLGFFRALHRKYAMVIIFFFSTRNWNIWTLKSKFWQFFKLRNWKKFYMKN